MDFLIPQYSPLRRDSGVPTVGVLGFETTNNAFLPEQDKTKAQSNYGDYIAVNTLLHLQNGITPTKNADIGLVHHEELTFIIVHQVFELWFKLILADLRAVRGLVTELWRHPVSLYQRLATSLGYLQRCEKIFNHNQGTWEVLETMHPGDFLEFRDYLVPASGFQSSQFRELEIMLGLQESRRSMINGRVVWAYLSQAQQAQLIKLAEEPSINDTLLDVLCNIAVPEGFLAMFLRCTLELARERQYRFAKCKEGDQQAEAQITEHYTYVQEVIERPWEHVTPGAHYDNEKFRKALVAALYVTSYRAEPPCALIAQLLDHLIAVEEGMLLWRSRHMHMVERMIGRRVGTGGSSGVDYLDQTRRYRIFDVLWILRKIFIRSTILMRFEELHAGTAIKDVKIFVEPRTESPPPN
jgi:tryptophan 2,3-dioxygenase